METSISSSIDLCPINFKEFNKINKSINNIEATLLFAKLKFHETKSKIEKNGKIYIARSRSQIASWFDFDVKKIDRLISLLERSELIEKKIGLWFGKKKLFLSSNKKYSHIPVNMKMLQVLIEQTGSLKSALVFSRISYSFANTKICHEKKRWCCLNKNELSNWSGMSIRTIDKILEELIKKGLILKKKFIWQEKLQTHFHIPLFVINIIKDKIPNFTNKKKKLSKSNNNHNEINQYYIENSNFKNDKNTKLIFINEADKINTIDNSCSHFYLEQAAKKGVSISKRTKEKKTNNLTVMQNLSTKKYEDTCDIIFNTFGKNLNRRQIKYLETAIRNTIQNYKIKVSNPDELIEQIKFSISNIQQCNGIKSYKHAISRCMKILRDGNWRTPFGFYKYSSYGSEIKNLHSTWENERISHQQVNKNYTQQITSQAGIYGHNSLTNNAMSLAKQLVNIANKSHLFTVASNISEMFNKILKQLEWYIRQGANKTSILDYLRQHIELKDLKY